MVKQGFRGGKKLDQEMKRDATEPSGLICLLFTANVNESKQGL